MGSEKFNRFKQGSGSGLDQLVYLNQSECVKGSSVVGHNVFDNLPDPDNQLVNSSSHLLHYPFDSNLVDMMVPKVPIFGNESFLELVNCFPRPDSSQIRVASCYTNYVNNNNGVATDSQEYCQISEEGGMGVSTNGKRKFSSDSHSNANKNVGGEHQKAPSMDASECSKEQHGKKQKTELNNSPNLKSKQVKDDSSGEEPPKENYVHMRAKRGQATNNHSLAERVRREKISERMKLLQELVPGCNKITGKALMLDEIINYVQSLQQQVEFLSMKLSTVNPKLNFDIEQILSKDILHSQRSNAALLGLGPGSSSLHPFAGISHGTFTGTPGATPLLHQYVMDNELQSLLHTGFDSNSYMNNMGPNGRSKLEL